MASQAKNVWAVCQPRSDLFSSDLDASVFAISLDSVCQGKADPAYTDPEKFFHRTYLTQALSDLLERVIGRLAGQHRGTPVIRLQTPFGGGKTHTMTALYHIARSPQVVGEHAAIKKILQELSLRQLPANIRVAVLDGRALDVHPRHHAEGISVRTLWGELAIQLGGPEAYELLADADRAQTPPGSERITQLLERYQPALILMDEVVEYLVKAKAVKVGDSNLMEQTSTFLAALSTAVSALPQVVLLVALPSSSLEVSQDDPEAAEWLLQQTVKLFSRVELVETPVARDEVFGVLRQRLFEHLGDPRDHKRAVEAMLAYYEDYAPSFPQQFRTPEYKKRMIDAYPFHPELIDLLYNRWGPHPQFQRTRGALRLLALVVRRIWNAKPKGMLLIQPYHINLRDRMIYGDILKLTERGMESVIDGDILDKARKLEIELGREYASEELGQAIATCILLYNIHGATPDSRLQAVTEEEIRTAVLRPPLNPALVSEMLPRLRERLWYLRWIDNRYQFTVRPNLNKVILDNEQELKEEDLDRRLQQYLSKVAGTGAAIFDVLICPQEPELIPDRERPTLVLLPWNVQQPEEWMRRAVERAGDGPRANRNMLVFLVPDSTRVQRLRQALRRLMALEKIKGSATFRNLLDETDREEVERQLRDKDHEVTAILKGMYEAIWRFGPEGPRKIEPRTPDIIKTGDLSEYVKKVLTDEGVLVQALSPDFLIHAKLVRLESGEETPISQVITIFTGNLGAPLIPNPSTAVRNAVQQGVAQRKWSIKVGGKTYGPKEVIDEVTSSPSAVIVPPEPEPPRIPPPPPPPQVLRLEIRTAADQLHQLMIAAGEIRNLKDATALLVVEDRTGKLAELRPKLEETLRDFGCSITWTELGETLFGGE